jgi:glycosidase
VVTPRYVTALPILSFLAGCATGSVTPEGDAAMPLGLDAPPGDGAVDGGPPLEDAGPPVASWSPRSCSVTLRFAPRAGASSVAIAGDFTGWGDAPIAMSDADGDGVYAITLGPERGIVPGTLHGYRIIVDGEYLIDPDASHRKYQDACLNSAFLAPACDAGPEIVPESELVARFDPATGTGSAAVTVAILTATDGAPPISVALTLDGAPVDAALDRERGRYDVALSGIATGRHLLSIRATDAMSRQAEPIDLPFWIEEREFEWRDATMYMIVVDRFADGDPSIDAPVGAPVERPADFHGGDLQGIRRVLESGYFEELGVDVLWLSPINDQAEGHFAGREDAHRYAGYHGYWPERAREVEPRFGGGDALAGLVEAAHARGIRVLLDLINNQVHEQHEYFAEHPEWFRTGCVCGIDPGCGWSERPLDCLFATYLPDIDWRVPAAEAQFTADALYWIEQYGIDGFRIDAVKHVETNSIFDLRAATARRYEQAGYRHYFVGETAVTQGDSVDYGCGERYASGYEWIDAYTGPRALDGQFDFPSHHRMPGLVEGTMSWDAVETVISDAQRLLDPAGLHVRFLGTHDSSRIATRAARDPSGGCRWSDASGCGSMPAVPTDPAVYARIRRALAVLYTMPGIPFLYYGDEIALAGGNDPDNRRDMPWEGELGAVSMSTESISAVQRALRDFVGALGRARDESVALRRGRRITLLVEEDLYVIAWAGERPGELAVMAANRGGGVAGRAIDGLTAGQLEGVGSFEASAGAGALRREAGGDRLRLDVPAGEAVLFLAR